MDRVIVQYMYYPANIDRLRNLETFEYKEEGFGERLF